ncbi:MAG: alpha/beta hydrolase domain-containing protein [Acidimicrobiia bacterium]
MRTNRIVVIAALAVVVDTGVGTAAHAAASAGARAQASAAVPTVTGPVTGGSPGVLANAMTPSLKKKYRYTEREYFLSGTATAYRPDGTWTEDGRWGVQPTTTAPYKTRIIVRAPRNPKRFSGIVVLEWMNETAGRDADPDFGFAYPEMLAHGDAYVAVSAQALGVVGGAGAKLPIPGYNPTSLTKWDPTRYGSLTHPGDDYSYDVFSQAAAAVRATKGVKPLGALKPRRLVAAGESQSAARMVTYANAIQPVSHAFDGFVIHSRGNSAASLATGAPAPPAVAHIRDDLTAPVMQLETETDLFGLGFVKSRQADTDRLRTWEMAGTAHADQSTLDYGETSGRSWDKVDTVPDFTQQCGSINNGQQAQVVRAAFAAMDGWVTKGTKPTQADAITLKADGSAIERDEHGNAVGGVRTPSVDAPISTLSGEMDKSRSVICSLFGSVTPFDAATLQQLYPTHADYVAKVTRSARRTVGNGFMLRPDAAIIVAQARRAPVPS